MRSAPLHPVHRPGSLARHDDPFLPGRHPLRHLQAQRRGDARPGRRPQGPHRQGPAGRRRGVAQAPRRARQAAAARARAGAARSRLAVPRAVAARRAWTCTTTRRRGSGIITGIGRVSGVECVIVCNDATVKGGTYYPMTVKKHLRAQEVAMENRLPCIYLVDSGGANLPQSGPRCSPTGPFRPHLLQPGQHVGAGHPADRRGDGLVHRGRRLCAGDERRDRHRAQAGHDLPGRPAAGEGRDRRDRQRRGSGRRRRACPHLGRGRPLRPERQPRARHRRGASWPTSTGRRTPSAALLEPREPKYAAEELYGVDPGRHAASPTTCARSSPAWSTAASSTSSSTLYGTTLVTGFARIWGYPVGIVANNGILFNESALKGAHFIELCCQRGIPLLFLQNITGFMVGRKYEAGGIARDGAKMVTAVVDRAPCRSSR